MYKALFLSGVPLVGLVIAGLTWSADSGPNLPSIRPDGEYMVVRYDWTRKDPRLGAATVASVPHYANGVWLNRQEGDYGAYTILAKDSSCTKGWQCTQVKVRYMTIPTDAKPDASALYIEIDYDTVHGKFKKVVYMPDGEQIIEQGNFRILEQGKSGPPV
jgi:hypothetical protein